MTRVLLPLKLVYIDGRTWIVDELFAVESDVLGGELHVVQGESTDFNSVPLGLWNLLPPADYGEAAVCHDVLYKYGTYQDTPITRETADRVHREFVRWRNAPRWKAWVYYRALRLGGWVAWRKYRKLDPEPDFV